MTQDARNTPVSMNEAAPLELRARSYLDVNCSHCHGGQDLDRAVWDARITVPLNHQNIVMGPLLGGGGDDDRIRTVIEMQDLERRNIVRALQEAGWKVSGAGGAAELLGCNPNTLSSRLKALGIRRPDRGHDMS